MNSDHDTHRKTVPNGTVERETSPKDTAQASKDSEEKRRHPASENALESSQDKNPIPDDSVKK